MSTTLAGNSNRFKSDSYNYSRLVLPGLDINACPVVPDNCRRSPDKSCPKMTCPDGQVVFFTNQPPDKSIFSLTGPVERIISSENAMFWFGRRHFDFQISDLRETSYTFLQRSRDHCEISDEKTTNTDARTRKNTARFQQIFL